MPAVRRFRAFLHEYLHHHVALNERHVLAHAVATRLASGSHTAGFMADRHWRLTSPSRSRSLVFRQSLHAVSGRIITLKIAIRNGQDRTAAEPRLRQPEALPAALETGGQPFETRLRTVAAWRRDRHQGSRLTRCRMR
jgi:hypothetical protein